MDDVDSEWRRQGATLSHKTAQEEFGLTWEEIVRAVRAGKLHCQQQSMHGNPWLRLLRREVEALVKGAWRQLPEGPSGENGTRTHQSGTEATEKPDSRFGRQAVKADRWRNPLTGIRP